jgi:hypothetical protein
LRPAPSWRPQRIVANVDGNVDVTAFPLTAHTSLSVALTLVEAVCVLVSDGVCDERDTSSDAHHIGRLVVQN